MKQRTKKKLIDSIDESHRQLNLVRQYIIKDDFEGAYRILTSTHLALHRTRITLFSKLHREIKKTVVKP